MTLIEPAGGLLLPKHVVEEKQREKELAEAQVPRPFTDGQKITFMIGPKNQYPLLPEYMEFLRGFLFRALLFSQSQLYRMPMELRVVAHIQRVPATYHELRMFEVLHDLLHK